MTKLLSAAPYTTVCTAATLLVHIIIIQFSSCNASSYTSPAFAFLPSKSRAQLQQKHIQQQSPRFSSTSLLSSMVNEIPSDATLDEPLTSSSSSSESGYLGGDPETILQSRNKLLALSTALANNSPSGKFVTRPSDKIKLQNAINELEAKAATVDNNIYKELMLGDWTLIVTANLPTSDIRRRFDNNYDDDDD